MLPLRFPNSGIKAKLGLAHRGSAHKGAGCRVPARDYRPRPALPPAGAVAPTAAVATFWQGGYRRARVAATYTGVAAVAV
ncbi:hypothetical protein B296_00027253 [Ensete ventricosum]|uniref:Uncharacterized protein n=1 Tax=Ensete ventricosum TaxID=4639 RepID=A0A426XEH3_ENSVE|nr:hypothetical protein B296_00027253 [Ensete ventricosum]